MSGSAALGVRVGQAFFGNHRSLRPVQNAALGPVLAGADVVIRAGTGSGKTEAAAAPLVERYLDELDRADGSVVVFVSPTRALANDLHRRLEPLLDRLGLVCGVRHGEHDDANRVKPPELLITTPESLDVLTGQTHRCLRSLRAVVIDEAHLLYNTQRGQQLAIVLERLERWLARDLQALGLSATVGSAADVWEFFRPGREVVQIDDDAGRGLALQTRLFVSPEDLAGLLRRYHDGPPAKILVFTNSRRQCDLLADTLREHSGFGDATFAHHASLSKDERLRVEAEFQTRSRAVCVATSTLELGIDIGDINLVVLYGLPANWQSFLQRIGRGNRRAETQEALLCVPADGRSPRGVATLVGFQALQFQITTGANTSQRPYELFGAAAQQMASIADAAKGFVKTDEFVSLFARWRHLDDEIVATLADDLAACGVLQRHPVYRKYGPDDALHELRRRLEVWGNLPISARDIDVVNAGVRIGAINASNAPKLAPGDRFPFAARRWEVLAVERDAIKVRPTKDAPNKQIKFSGPAAPLDPALAESIRTLLSSGDVGDTVRPATLASELRAQLAPLRPFAQDDVLPMGNAAAASVFVTFAGQLANQAIAVWAGCDPAKAGPLTVELSRAVDWSRLPTRAADLAPYLAEIEFPSEELSRFQQMLSPELQLREAQNRFLCEPVHDRVLRRLAGAVVRPLPDDLLKLIVG